MYTEANRSLLNMSLTINEIETKAVTIFTDPNKATLIDETTYFILQLVFYVILSCVFGIMGTITNIINMIIFIKQGLFSGGSVLVLFFLSVADLGVSFTNVLHSLCFAMIAADIPDLSFDPFAIAYLLFGWPHSAFYIVNRILTAFVALERCLCVVVPFRVKRIFTPHRSLAYIISIFAYSFLSLTPFYWTHRLGYELQSGTNASKLVLTFGPNHVFWHDVVHYTNFLFISFFCVIVVVVCTAITSMQVKTSKDWRKSTTTTNTTAYLSKTNADESVTIITKPLSASTDIPSNSHQTSNTDHDGTNIDKNLNRSKLDKEARLVKMISMISIIFLICNLPEFTIAMLQMMDDRMRVTGQYERLSLLFFSIVFVFATVNSSINIFVYYSMSTNYRKEFLAYFSMDKS